MKRILILTAIICGLFLFYSSESGTPGKVYAESPPDSTGMDFVSIEKIKQTVINDIIASGYDKNLKDAKEYLRATTWGPIVLVKIETKAQRFRHVDYYYIVHGILPGQGIVAYSTLNAITGKLLMNGYIFRQYGNRYLITGQEAVDYARDRLDIPDWVNYTISTVLNFAYPLNYDYSDWKYKIVFDQYITTREGMTDTIYVDPYIVAVKREPPTHLNARHSDVYPDRIFILIQSARHPDLQGLR
jgi:hypothetical protein